MDCSGHATVPAEQQRSSVRAGVQAACGDGDVGGCAVSGDSHSPSIGIPSMQFSQCGGSSANENAFAVGVASASRASSSSRAAVADRLMALRL